MGVIPRQGAARAAGGPWGGWSGGRMGPPPIQPDVLPWSGTGDPDPHARQGRTSLFGDRQRSVVTKKARSVVALSRVPRGERGAPVRLRLPLAGARKQVLA